MRLAAAAVTLAVLVGGAGWSVVAAIPLRTEVRYHANQSPPALAGKTPPRVINRHNPPYPAEALPYSPGAMVWVALTIGSNGEVTAAKASRWRLTIESSIDDPNYWANKPERAFIEAAESAALKFKFAAPDANTLTSVEVLFTFRNIPPGGSPDRRHAVRVGGDIEPPIKVGDVRPIYPAAAREAGVQGLVIMEIRVATDGSVVDATVVQSIPMLDDAALQAVRQWRYQPTLLNGEPVEVIMTVTINFIAQ
jgi:TonB family protein